MAPDAVRSAAANPICGPDTATTARSADAPHPFLGIWVSIANIFDTERNVLEVTPAGFRFWGWCHGWNPDRKPSPQVGRWTSEESRIEFLPGLYGSRATWVRRDLGGRPALFMVRGRDESADRELPAPGMIGNPYCLLVRVGDSLATPVTMRAPTPDWVSTSESGAGVWAPPPPGDLSDEALRIWRLLFGTDVGEQATAKLLVILWNLAAVKSGRSKESALRDALALSGEPHPLEVRCMARSAVAMIADLDLANWLGDEGPSEPWLRGVSVLVGHLDAVPDAEALAAMEKIVVAALAAAPRGAAYSADPPLGEAQPCPSAVLAARVAATQARLNALIAERHRAG